MREFKDSGIPWIGGIPKDWTIELIGNQVKEVNNPNIDCLEDNALQFKMGAIISKSRGDSKYNPETLEGYNIVDKGVIMLNGLNLSFDLISQRVGLVRERGVITSTYLAVKPTNNIDSEYLTYLFKAYDNCKAFHSMGRGLRQTLSYGELRKYLLVYPSLAEQQRIAEFLNRKCAEVDEMIALQEQIIEELKAYKQSVITEAVTKGLNPDAPMRDSGIEWIGQIPQGWYVTKFYRVCSVITDFVASGSFESLRINVPYLDYPDYAMLVRTIDLSGKGRASEKVYISEHSYNFLQNSNLYGGEIVLPNIGASVGDVYIVPQLYERMSLAPNAIMFKTEYCDKYWYYYFYSQAGKQSIFDICQSTAQPKFNKTELRNIRVCIPTLSEQQAIADYLDEKCADIDSLILTKQEKIDSLKEYKKSIIYEYVTGKREVI